MQKKKFTRSFIGLLLLPWLLYPVIHPPIFFDLCWWVVVLWCMLFFNITFSITTTTFCTWLSNKRKWGRKENRGKTKLLNENGVKWTNCWNSCRWYDKSKYWWSRPWAGLGEILSVSIISDLSCDTWPLSLSHDMTFSPGVVVAQYLKGTVPVCIPCSLCRRCPVWSLKLYLRTGMDLSKEQ